MNNKFQTIYYNFKLIIIGFIDIGKGLITHKGILITSCATYDNQTNN